MGDPSLLRPFFIVGADRSGTTMLRLMLNQHAELLVPQETWFMIDLMNELPLTDPLTELQKQRAYELIVTHKRWSDLGIRDYDLAIGIETLAQPTLGALLETVFGQLLNRTTKRRWGDKTPEYVIEIARLHEVFPQAQFIHVIRDARDVCLSLLRKRWRGTRTPNVARFWANYVHRGITAGRSLPDKLYLEIHYESLVQNTVNTLGSVCEFLGVDFNPAMMFFYESANENIAPWERDLHKKVMRPPCLDDVYRWRTESSMLQVMAVEALAGTVMDEVGQRKFFEGPAKLMPWVFKVLEGIFFRTLAVRRCLKKLVRQGVQRYRGKPK